MARQRRGSNVSNTSSMPAERGDQVRHPSYGDSVRDSQADDHCPQQELASMYDYLAKIILLGPSGSGKSCLLHRFVKNEWRVLSSQTIGVEFASKIIKVGTGSRRQRIKLQLWDTAGTERFRSVSRSYYRGAAGAILVYDIASLASFNALPTFLNDARALASPNLTVLLAGNKADVAAESAQDEHLLDQLADTTSLRLSKQPSASDGLSGSISSATGYGLGARLAMTRAPNGREVSATEAARWASSVSVPVTLEVSAYSGEGVDEMFARLARMILTKIELGEIDPDDPQSGIQYGDSAAWGDGDASSVKSGATTIEEGGLGRRRRKGRDTRSRAGMREWEDVFRLDAVGRQRRGGCC